MDDSWLPFLGSAALSFGWFVFTLPLLLSHFAAIKGRSDINVIPPPPQQKIIFCFSYSIL
ncbi:hypothetical protein [Mycoplasma bovis]|uniref:hypothetical protein n=1 Tax=Mycoplasmopsis bovis TaxID=28903 RepID=UPI001BDECE4D|nr:hypothetical protein [Mycoplasmopsis bovis]